MVRKIKFHEVRCDHLPDGVGVDETAEEDEGHEVVVEDGGVEEEVERDERPGDEEGEEAEEGAAGFVATRAAGLDYI